MLPSWLYGAFNPVTKPTLHRADWFTSSFLLFYQKVPAALLAGPRMADIPVAGQQSLGVGNLPRSGGPRRARQNLPRDLDANLVSSVSSMPPRQVHLDTIGFRKEVAVSR